MWQDWVLATLQWIFVLALIPALFDATQKPALLTSITTGTCIYIMAATYATLGLWTAVVSSLTLGSAWLILAYQRWRLNNRSD